MVEFHQKCNKWGYTNGEINLKYFYSFIDSPYLISICIYIYIYIYIYTVYVYIYIYICSFKLFIWAIQLVLLYSKILKSINNGLAAFSRPIVGNYRHLSAKLTIEVDIYS